MSPTSRIVVTGCCLSLAGMAAAQMTQAVIPPPRGLPDDETVWPNRASYRNSDPWLWQHHDQIRVMHPRVLVLNFANDVSMEQIRKHAGGVIRAMAEATRYHGYQRPDAPAFLQYQVVRYVDLRDRSGPRAGKRMLSSLFPVKKDRRPSEVLCDYAALFGEAFAPRLGFRDTRDENRYLTLRELVNAGWVHELWLYAIHDGPDWPARETCESKQFYDAQCRPIPGKHGQCGNGTDRTMPWIGRSFRICFFNPHRGVGCAMENFGHTLEWMATTHSIEYFARYFIEYAQFDLDRRYGVPFAKLYETDYARKDSIEYPTPRSMIVWIGQKQYRIEPYVAIGGSVHFPPGARHHYDLTSPYRVMSTIEHYRLHDGPDGHDRAEPFDRSRFERFGDVAPDCMGRWVVYWCQNMPGLENHCVDDAGRPMKNWWVFLFY